MAVIRMHFLFHPRSPNAKAFAERLMRCFVEPPASGGLRIPVYFTRDMGDDLPPTWEGEDPLALDAAEHTLVVVLADARMLRTVDGGTGDAWRSFFAEGIRRAHAESSRHYVMGLALDPQGYALADQEHMLSVKPGMPTRLSDEPIEHFQQRFALWTNEVIDEAALQITIRAIQRLDPRVADSSGKHPIRLFLSHAKADLATNEEDPVRFVEAEVKELPVDYWFDASEIPPSSKFATEIERGIRDSSIVVSFLTDWYSSRLWCQREVLDAKRHGVPLLVVDALTSGESRHFPYMGNAPTIHWSGKHPREEARRVVARAARETLRFMLNRRVLAHHRDAANPETILGAAPEALTVVHNSHANPPRRFLYPDPPLAEPELDIIKALAPGDEFTTPLSKLAQRLRDCRRVIAVSISNSDNLAAKGLSPEHERTLTDEVHLYLLLAGCQIAYGGSLEARFERASNFTLRLFELVRAYSPLARLMGHSLHPIINYAPWPLNLGYDDDVLNLFGTIAELKRGARPPLNEVPEPDDVLFPVMAGKGRKFPCDTPERRLAWARGLTIMRAAQTDSVAARVVIGGRTGGYSGLYPGIVEEAWITIVAKKPLYLIGGFGGAADAVIEAITNRDPLPILRACQPPQLSECLQLAQQRDINMISMKDALPDIKDLSRHMVSSERMAHDISTAAANELASALNNGLTNSENESLLKSSDPGEIAALVLRGLTKI